MFLPSEVLSEVFSSISRQQLADLQLVNQEFDSIIGTKVYPLHVIDVVHIFWFHDLDDTNEEGKGKVEANSEKHGRHLIDLYTSVDSAPIPSYLRFLYIQLLSPAFFPPSFFTDQLTNMENSFDSAELTVSLPSGGYENEHELRLQALEIIEKITPAFHKVRDIRLFWCYGYDEYKALAAGPVDDINILSTPLLLNCRRLLLHVPRLHTDRLGLVSPDQVVNWLFRDEEEDKDGRYLVICVNQGAEAVLKDLISKKVESKNERRCEVIVENRDRNYCEEGAIYPDPFDLISERAKSMIERHSDVVVEFPNCDLGRIYKYPRKIFDE